MKKYTVTWRQMRIYAQITTIEANSFSDAIKLSANKLTARGWFESGRDGSFCSVVERKESKKGANDGKKVSINDAPKKLHLGAPKFASKGLDRVGDGFWANVEGDEIEDCLAVPKGRKKVLPPL